VHAGGQAVVGVVESLGGGDRPIPEDQPPAKEIAHASVEVEHGQRRPARTEHAIERLDVLLQCLRILPQHFRDSEGGWEQREAFVVNGFANFAVKGAKVVAV
jgi:hypothetical protein